MENPINPADLVSLVTADAARIAANKLKEVLAQINEMRSSGVPYIVDELNAAQLQLNSILGIVTEDDEDHKNEHPAFDPNLPQRLCCIICEKQLDYDRHGLVGDAGFVVATFHYGSRHDQCLGFNGRKSLGENPKKLDRMLASDKIEGHICDDCFEQKLDYFSGYDIIKTRDEERVA